MNSGIEWTEATWNPVTGCTKVSPGCANCYAERMAHRLRAMGQQNYRNGFAVTLHERMLPVPLTWRKPRMIFVNSMSDLFHRDVPFPFIERTFDVMRSAPQYTFQVLTKRSERLAEIDRRIGIPRNVWLGVSVESEECLGRVDDLRKTHAAVRFLSLEPLLGPLPDLDLDGIGWVIAGGESGPGARPMEPDWVRSIRDRCQASRVPFFFKQWGGAVKKRTGRILDGRTWDETPARQPAARDPAHEGVAGTVRESILEEWDRFRG
jgi:protein gp37